MKSKMARLKFFSLLLLLPGLAGLITSAMVSVHYADSLPKWPVLEQGRTVPRSIHGFVVYQTAEEDRNLSEIEYTSVGVFLAGLGLGLLYLQKWGMARMIEADESDSLARDLG